MVAWTFDGANKKFRSKKLAKFARTKANPTAKVFKTSYDCMWCGKTGSSNHDGYCSLDHYWKGTDYDNQ